MTTLCVLSDLPADQCACRDHRGDPGDVEQLDDLSAGPASRGGVRIEIGATFDSTIARWQAPKAGTCGMRGCPIRPGDVVGRDTSGVLICPRCLPDAGSLGDHRSPSPAVREPEATPVPIPNLLERTRASVGGVTSREGASNE